MVTNEHELNEIDDSQHIEQSVIELHEQTIHYRHDGIEMNFLYQLMNHYQLWTTSTNRFQMTKRGNKYLEATKYYSCGRRNPTEPPKPQIIKNKLMRQDYAVQDIETVNLWYNV
eukprot:2277522-Amphidinium_carterae.1